MADNGVESINTDELAAVDDLLGHRDGAVGRVLISVLGTQLVGSGPVADAIAEATAQVTSDVIWAATWTDLQTYTPATDGVGAEVMDADTGTHSAASATGYDGATVDNAGRYAWNLGWGRWVRISDTGLSAKSDVGHTHTADQISDSSAAGRALLTAEDAEAQRGALGLGSAATAASSVENSPQLKKITLVRQNGFKVKASFVKPMVPKVSELVAVTKAIPYLSTADDKPTGAVKKSYMFIRLKI